MMLPLSVMATGVYCTPKDTSNNAYCGQTQTGCSEDQKQGTRDAYGNCNHWNQCSFDSFSNLQCVKGQCDAECAVSADCTHTHKCSGTKQQTRTASCSSHDCECNYGGWGSAICVAGQCGAQCDSDNDCNSKCEDNIYFGTGDCTGNCMCSYTQQNCNDDNQCTLDNCDAEKGCSHTALSCDDLDACTADSCDPATGCVHTPITCNDENACTQDSCDQGCVFAPVECDDNDACTLDSCDEATGCTHDPLSCDDQDSSTKDRCDSEIGCIHTPTDNEAPEFGTIAALVALAGAVTAFFIVRK